MTYAKFGEKGEKQETVWRGPLDVDRTHTDVPYLAAFGIFVAFWIIVAIYAFSVGVAIEVHYSNAMHHLDFIEATIYFGYHMPRAIHIILGFLLLSTALLALFVALFRWATKVLVYITIVAVTILILLLYALAIFMQFYMEEFCWITTAAIIVSAIVYGMTMYAFSKIGVEVVCKVIKESCKALFFFPSTLLFMAAQFILHLIVVIFAGSVYGFLRTITISDDFSGMNITTSEPESEGSGNFNDSWYYDDEYFQQPLIVPTHICILHVINAIGFLWATQFIMGLGRMVLTATFATWYHVRDKDMIPRHTITKCFLTIVTYHSGTIAFASSLASIIPMFCIIWKHGRERARQMYKKPILLLSWLTVLFKFSFNALSMCAIHGKTFYTSAKDSYILLMKNPMSYLVINNVTESVVFLGTLLVPLLSFLSVFGYCFLCHKSLTQSAKVTAVMIVTMTSLLKSLIFFMVFRAASNTIRHCYLEDSKARCESELDLYNIHIDDFEVDNEGHSFGREENLPSNKNIDVAFIKEQNPALIEDVSNASYAVNIPV